jgi:trk system potassium uptake protein TrkA
LCKQLSDKFPDALILNADISSEEIFEEEQFHNYDLIISITNNEELNILSSIYAKSLGTKRAIAIVTKSNYFQIARKLDIDSIINPKESTVNAVLKYVRRGDIKSIHRLFNGKAEVIEFKIEKETHIPGMKIKELNMPEDSLILSIIRNSEIIIPDGEFVFNEDDIVITIMKKDSVKKWEENFISG